MFKKPLYFLMSVILMMSFLSCSNQEVYLKIRPEKQKPLAVVFERAEGAFCLVGEGKAAALLVDSNDAEVVKIAAEDFAKDVDLVCGVQPELILTDSSEQLWQDCVVIGTLGSSRLIDACIEKGLISAGDIRGQWENFKIEVVKLSEGHRLLVVVGSDRRGTAYGVFELSKMMGVSPWVWWADVKPEEHKFLYIQDGPPIVQGPSVKYRGIFLNDEDWGLKPWASENMDTDIGDIGPKTYEHIFKLMLRLKANFLWPAMHECTKAFFYYKDNPKVAEKYAIVLGASHCEPMLRNNVDEWSHNFQSEYGERPGQWRYDTNKEQIYRYWQDRARESANIDCIYTVGMRAIHDSGMPGPPEMEGKIKLLEDIFSDQRKILSQARGVNADEVPQLFCPYKEVLDLYKNGLDVPEDVTIVWPDDNHGYIRRLPNPDEQKRPGGHGVYYHISYHGSPHSYLWLSTMSPAMISFELSRAYAFGADDIWVINVGDIKPQEVEAEFCMDLAWDINAWTPEKAHRYVRQWAARTFGAEFADDFAAIKREFYRLAHRAKPEHIYLSRAQITMELAGRRVEQYRKLAEQSKELEKRIPDELKDAYFQLLLYPVLCAGKIEEKIYYARKSLELVEKGDEEALEYAQKARNAHKEIQELTRVYNKEIAGGKWDGMMMRDSYPDARWLRNLAEGQPLIYEMPTVASGEIPEERTFRTALDLTNAEIKTPMTLKNGILMGNSRDMCEQDTGGSAEFAFLSENTQQGDLYFLAKTPTPEEDSWYITVNDQTIIANNQVTGDDWQWLNVGTFKLKRGQNLLTIAQREPNAQIQAIRFGRPGSSEQAKPLVMLSARSFINKKDSSNAAIKIIEDLGISGASVLTMPFTAPPIAENEIADAPYVEYEAQLDKGEYTVEVKCMPTFGVYEGRDVRYAVSVNGDRPQVRDISAAVDERNSNWARGVLRGYASSKTTHTVDNDGKSRIRIYFMDAALAVSEIEIK